MSKKIIDWDELRAELLSDSEVQASLMQKSARNACGDAGAMAQSCWSDARPGGGADGRQRTDGITNGSKYYPGESRYINALCAGVRGKASADNALLKTGTPIAGVPEALSIQSQSCSAAGEISAAWR